MWEILLSKPVLIGLHLAFAIIGIDAFLWLLGEIKNGSWRKVRLYWSAGVGVLSFLLSWLFQLVIIAAGFLIFRGGVF